MTDNVENITPDEIKRTFDILHYSVKKYNNSIALASKIRGKWHGYSHIEYLEIVNSLSYGLLHSGIKKGDKICTISNNRPEWNFLDMAINQVGAVHVPLFPNYNEDDLSYILDNSDAKLVFVFNKALWEIINKLSSEITCIEKVYRLDRNTDVPHIWELIESGKENQNKSLLESRMNEITEKDLASIYYTSGTGGCPKGVMVMHQNIVQMVHSLSINYDIYPDEKVLSYLPLSHSYESGHNYIFQFKGISIYYAENVGTVIDNLSEVKPVMFLTVPLLLEKIINGLINNEKFQKGLNKKLLNLAISLSKEYHIDQHQSIWFKLKLALSYNRVFKQWKSMIGGNIRIISAGGASLPEHFGILFWLMGIKVLEVYGLTETYCITVNSIKKGIKFGTVGTAVDNVEVRLTEEGEILCRSPFITIGYHKDPKLTSEIIDKDGWFHTGDIGKYVDNKFLKITGRKKDVFKTSSGNFVSPEEIERNLEKSPFIKDTIIVGKDQNFLSAVIVPDFNYIENWCKQNNESYSNPVDLVNNEKIINQFQKIIDNYNKKVWDTEMIKKFELLTTEWSTQTGELTPLQKLKRNIILNKHKDIIDSFYSQNN